MDATDIDKVTTAQEAVAYIAANHASIVEQLQSKKGGDLLTFLQKLLAVIVLIVEAVVELLKQILNILPSLKVIVQIIIDLMIKINIGGGGGPKEAPTGSGSGDGDASHKPSPTAEAAEINEKLLDVLTEIKSKMVDLVDYVEARAREDEK